MTQKNRRKEGKISELENKTIEIIQSEHQRLKRLKTKT